MYYKRVEDGLPKCADPESLARQPYYLDPRANSLTRVSDTIRDYGVAVLMDVLQPKAVAALEYEFNEVMRCRGNLDEDQVDENDFFINVRVPGETIAKSHCKMMNQSSII